MLKQLRAGKGDGTYDRRLTKIAEVDLLIIDDLGLRPLAHDEPVDLYEVIRLRYERGATVLTSNRDEEELHALFGDPLLASAAMDRLLHHAHVVRLEGDSYRNSKNGPAKTAAPRRHKHDDIE
jgi:DNA replication protein DnaC